MKRFNFFLLIFILVMPFALLSQVDSGGSQIEKKTTTPDVIVVTAGDTVKTTILETSTEGVRYRRFQKTKERFLKTRSIRTVIFASGKIWTPGMPGIVIEPAIVPGDSITATVTNEGETSKASWKKHRALQPVATFDSGWVWQLSYEFVSNIKNEELQYRTNSFPALGLTIEKAIRPNVGLGITLAGRWWGDPTLAYNFLYASVGIRGTYHINIHPKLDPYVGGALSYRRGQFWNKGFKEGNGRIGANLLIGTRYYITPRLGIALEAGSDGIAKFRGGLTYRFP